MSANRNRRRNETNKITAGGPPPPRNLKKERRTESKLTRARKIASPIRPNDIMPDVHTWSKLLKDPFDYDPGNIGMPLSEDNYPCPSAKGSNYAVESVRGLTGSDIFIRCYPDAELDTNFHMRPFANGNATPGPIWTQIDTLSATYQGAACSWAYGLPTDNMVLFADTPALTAIKWPNLIVPTMVPITASGTNAELRTYAYGIRVTFSNDLASTRGNVEFVQAREGLSGTPGQNQVSLAQLRQQDPSYRRRFFGDRRTQTFVWHPNCDSVKFAPIRGTTPVAGGVNARMGLRITGLTSDDEVLVEVRCYQELKYNGIAKTATITPVSPDAIQVQNALVTHHGFANADDRGRSHDLHTEVMAHKVASHPKLRSLVQMVEGAGILQGARTVAPKLLKGLGKVIGTAEELAPLLLTA